MPEPRSTDSPARPSISAVLPAYNEEAVITATVQHVASVLANLQADFEIIVVNDGSRDGTAEILAQLQRTSPELHLQVVTHPRNQGYGAALASGFEAATKELIFFTDGDKQFNVEEIATFLPAMTPDVDLVIGYRAKRADPLLRLLNARGWKFLINGLFGFTARDVDCAFKLFRTEVWRSFSVSSRGATFSAEFLIKACRRGFSVRELPVSHFPRTAGVATGARPAVIVRAFQELLRLRLRLERDLRRDSRQRRQF